MGRWTHARERDVLVGYEMEWWSINDWLALLIVYC